MRRSRRPHPAPPRVAAAGIAARVAGPVLGRYYAAFVLVFFTVSVINNNAYAYHISVPLHTIFRSGSLVASLIVGAACLGKRRAPSTRARISPARRG